MKKTPENIKLGDWIFIGANNAVISRIYQEEKNRIEVVYLDRNRAINDDAHYVNDRWEFVYSGASGGGYADSNPRLSEYVAKLRTGRWYEK